MKVTHLTIGTEIKKSANYQSGSGQFSLSVELAEDEDHIVAVGELRDEIVGIANELANEALAQCPRRK